MARKREIVFCCEECGRELEIEFHEGSQGEVVFVVQLCPRCLERRTDEAYEEGYSVGHTDGVLLKRFDRNYGRV